MSSEEAELTEWRAHLHSTTVSGLAVRRNVGLGSPTNSQPGRLRYVAQASGLRVLAASSRQFWWHLHDAPLSGGGRTEFFVDKQPHGNLSQLTAIRAQKPHNSARDITPGSFAT